MINVNSENKVVEYEIITTKKYRQVVKVQFDEKYSDKLDETKITPSDIFFGEGKEVEGDKTETFSTKIVNEPPNRFMTYVYQYNRTKLGWGNFVPNKTKVNSVFVFIHHSNRGNNNKNKVVFLSCSTDLVEQLWKSSNLEELSSYIVSYEYLGYDGFSGWYCDWNDKEEKVDNGLDILTLIHKKRNGKDTDIHMYEVQDYIEVGDKVSQPYHYHNEDGGGKKL
jgi:hypothetical protein